MERTPCSSTTTKGTPCKRKAFPGADRCRQHLGLGGGRKLEAITPEITLELVRHLEVGVALDTAIAAVGVARRTVYDWLEKAKLEEPAPEHVEFKAFIDEARARGETDLVQVVKDATKEDWKAATWLLERLYPERYSRPSVRPAPPPKVEKPETDPDEELPENVIALNRGSASGDADW